MLCKVIYSSWIMILINSSIALKNLYIEKCTLQKCTAHDNIDHSCVDTAVTEKQDV